jgi:hypothetical protein
MWLVSTRCTTKRSQLQKQPVPPTQGLRQRVMQPSPLTCIAVEWAVWCWVAHEGQDSLAHTKQCPCRAPGRLQNVKTNFTSLHSSSSSSSDGVTGEMPRPRVVVAANGVAAAPLLLACLMSGRHCRSLCSPRAGASYYTQPDSISQRPYLLDTTPRMHGQQQAQHAGAGSAADWAQTLCCTLLVSPPHQVLDAHCQACLASGRARLKGVQCTACRTGIMVQLPIADAGWYAASSAAHPEVYIWVEDLCLEAHCRRYQRILLRNIYGQLKGATFKRSFRWALQRRTQQSKGMTVCGEMGAQPSCVPGQAHSPAGNQLICCLIREANWTQLLVLETCKAMSGVVLLSNLGAQANLLPTLQLLDKLRAGQTLLAELHGLRAVQINVYFVSTGNLCRSCCTTHPARLALARATDGCHGTQR